MLYYRRESRQGNYVVPISIVVRNRVTSLRSSLKTPFSGSFSANSRTFVEIIMKNKEDFRLYNLN